MSNHDWPTVPPLVEGIEPAERLWLGEEKELQKRADLLREAYYRYRRILANGDGYAELAARKRDIEEKHKSLSRRLELVQSRLQYVGLLIQAYEEELEATAGSADAPLRTNWVERGDVVLQSPPGWCVMEVSGGDTHRRLRVRVTYQPTKWELRRRQIDRNDARESESPVFDGDTTWGAAIERLKKRREKLERSRKSLISKKRDLPPKFEAEVIGRINGYYIRHNSLPERVCPPDIFDGRGKIRSKCLDIKEVIDGNKHAITKRGDLETALEHDIYMEKPHSKINEVQEFLRDNGIQWDGWDTGDPHSFPGTISWIVQEAG